MEPTTPKSSKERIGQWMKIIAIAGAVLSLLTAILITDYHPRTDDASVRANFIEITAEVNGKLVALPVKDNAFVKKGDLLFEIDPRPYEYALQQALSDQDALEQQIIDAKRKIASEKSAVEATTAV
jgi:membrane fusion protein, multidrug efflux system